MSRLIICLLITITTIFKASALDFGLKFKSHAYPSDERTSLTLGENTFPFKKDFRIDFDFSFYSPSMFGNILSVLTDDGQCFSVVASRVEDGDFYLGVVCNDSLYHIEKKLTLTPENPERTGLTLDKANNLVTLRLNNDEISHGADLKNVKEATFFFGMGQENRQAVVAPFELQDIRVFIDNRNTSHWDLKYHESDSISRDNLGELIANVKNPHWLIDDHVDWHRIFSATLPKRVQTAFDPINEKFFIVTDDEIDVFSPLTGENEKKDIKGGSRVLSYSNHLEFDTLSNRLVNYNFNRGSMAFLDLDSRRWRRTDSDPYKDDEANYSNHAVAIDGDKLYAFGGYGFYRYHNDFFIADLKTGVIEEQPLTPELMPMTSSAAAVVDGILYIFGGKGNASGRQELPVRHSYALYAYDTSTWKGEKVWELDSVAADFIPSQSMYYDRSKDCFYLASTNEGGELVRISRTKPEIFTLSTPIGSDMEYVDFVFNLYRSSDSKRYYLVIDKRLTPESHDYSIYTISAPFIDDPKIIQNKTPLLKATDSKDHEGLIPVWLCLIICGVVAMGGSLIYFVKKRKRRLKNEQHSKSDGSGLENNEETQVSSEDKELSEMNEDNSVDEGDDKMKESDRAFMVSLADTGHNRAGSYFDSSRASISLLGGFKVRDKEGKDITDRFSSKLKNLLILLLLSSRKYESGVRYQVINEQIWDDKDEKSAQNNRNVSMRKLRILLEEVGNVVINYDKGFFRIDTGNVMFDYKELMDRMDAVNTGAPITPELIDQLLELLLKGPLLPNTVYEWLDTYKGEFSDRALTILSRLLKYEFGKDDNLAFRIAETVSLHDILNEEALIAKCRILMSRRKAGLAKNEHARFCKEYRRAMGEDYPIGFAEVCRRDL